MKQENYIKDSLYNCWGGEKKEYARGVIVGLVSGLMSQGFSFETSLSTLKFYVQHGIFDLTEKDVISCLPDCWVAEWEESSGLNFL